MLGPLEQLLLPALAAALPDGQDIQAGPAVAPTRASRVAVCAGALTLDDDAADAPLRDPAHLGWQGVLTARPGAALDFPLPPEAVGELAEVQSPPGRVLAAGDAFLIDGRTLRFFRAPAGPVFVRTRSAACAGYRSRVAGRIGLALQAWAQDMASADTLLTQGVGALLAQFETVNVIDLAGAPPRFGLRLAKPRLALAAVERGLDPDAPAWRLATARWHIDGEVELAVTLGEAEAKGRIGEVAIGLHLPRPR